jgi:dethiobiotin synthetase
MRRIVVLGTGTGVGKTHVTVALGRALAALDPAVRVGLLKPIETGIEPARESDAQRVQRENRGFAPPDPHPLYGFAPPISPHLAARRAARSIELRAVLEWLERWEFDERASDRDIAVIETAGGVFTPLGDGITNFELACALDPALWVLVAPDALGVLHELTATLRALEHAGRAPTRIVLSASRGTDESTGTNAAELRRLGIASPAAVFGAGESDASSFASQLFG